MPEHEATPVEHIPCCEFLRTKSQYSEPEEMRAGRGYVRPDATACYWCLRTHAAHGPDDAPTTPARCQPGRACYQRSPD